MINEQRRFIPKMESLGGFSREIVDDPQNTGWLSKKVGEIWIMPDRYVSNYTEQEFREFVAKPIEVLTSSPHTKNLIPKTKLEMEEIRKNRAGKTEVQGYIHMERVYGLAIETMTEIPPWVMEQIDAAIVACLEVDIATGVVGPQARRVRPDILSLDGQIQSFMIGTTVSSPEEPMVYLIDTHPAHYFDGEADFTLQEWLSACSELESRALLGARLGRTRAALVQYFQAKQTASVA